jgi:hypothetical protein
MIVVCQPFPAVKNRYVCQMSIFSSTVVELKDLTGQDVKLGQRLL